jgi:SAM-dependent methyltransferase
MLGVVAVGLALGIVVPWVIIQFEEPLKKVIEARRAKYDVPYVPTPQPVVEKMLQMAKVTKDDVVYDLGCGDGRIVITAAKQYGARGIGVDIDPQRIRESKANARKEGVTDQVTFVQRDLFKMELKDATVVTLYLLPEINRKLRPKLFRELRPGTRIVSHDFDMGEWQPKETVTMGADREHTLHYWTIPEKKDQPVFTDDVVATKGK